MMSPCDASCESMPLNGGHRWGAGSSALLAASTLLVAAAVAVAGTAPTLAFAATRPPLVGTPPAALRPLPGPKVGSPITASRGATLLPETPLARLAPLAAAPTPALVAGWPWPLGAVFAITGALAVLRWCWTVVRHRGSPRRRSAALARSAQPLALYESPAKCALTVLSAREEAPPLTPHDAISATAAGLPTPKGLEGDFRRGEDRLRDAMHQASRRQREALMSCQAELMKDTVLQLQAPTPRVYSYLLQHLLLEVRLHLFQSSGLSDRLAAAAVDELVALGDWGHLPDAVQDICQCVSAHSIRLADVERKVRESAGQPLKQPIAADDVLTTAEHEALRCMTNQTFGLSLGLAV